MSNLSDFLQPTLRGVRITLRPMVAEDFDALFSVASDPLLWEQHPEPTRYQHPVFERFFQSGLESKGALVGVLNDTGEIVPCSRFYNRNAHEHSICIGYTFVARRLWGSGVNREIKVRMVNHALKQAVKVLFEVGSNNFRSRRALEKIGAAFSHEIPSAPGDPSHVVYSMNAPMPEEA